MLPYPTPHMRPLSRNVIPHRPPVHRHIGLIEQHVSQNAPIPANWRKLWVNKLCFYIDVL